MPKKLFKRAKAGRKFRKKATARTGKFMPYGKMVSAIVPTVRGYGGMPQPARLRTRFTFEGVYTRVAAAITGEVYAIGLNYLYLPMTPTAGFTNSNANLTPIQGSGAIGVQTPLNFVKMCANAGLYDNYRVFASKIELTIAGVTGQDNLRFFLCPVSGATPPADITKSMQIHYAQSANSSIYTPNKKLTRYVTVSQVVGQNKRVIMDNPNYAAAYNVQPAAPIQWQFGWYITDNTNMGAPISITVRTTYYTELYNSNDNTVSTA